jgi:hypothetical protein
VAALGVLATEFPDSIEEAIKPYKPSVEEGGAAAIEAESRLWEITFTLPARKSRHGSGTSTGTETVLVDDRFFLETKKKTGKEKKSGGKRNTVAQHDTAIGMAPAPPANALYMRSSTKALWPLLIEKAWISLLGGAGYGDICPEEGVGFEVAAAKNIKPHSGCVIKCFTGIDYDMHVFEDRSDSQIWDDVSQACRNGMPCFVGTKGPNALKLYEQLERERFLKLFANHCYTILACAEKKEAGTVVRYVTIKNPHNNSQELANPHRIWKAKKEVETAAEDMQDTQDDSLRRDHTLAPQAALHRMSTVHAKQSMKKDASFKDAFMCTFGELRTYFHSYEMSKR